MASPSTLAASPMTHVLRRVLLTPLSTRITTPSYTQSWHLRSILSSSISIPAISVNIPGILSDIWEGILKAVPKKKTSHMKKRHRQLAGKALKDVNAVNTCPGCGKPKKAHTLCPYCVAEIRQSWKQSDKEAKEAMQAAEEARQAANKATK